MKLIHVFDEKDYTNDMPVWESNTVRAIIVKDGKIAVQKGNAGDYKILGGGMDKGEDRKTALAREVEEESGLLILPDTMEEMGEMQEIHRDLFKPNQIFLRHSYFYRCKVKDEMGVVKMTRSEKEAGYHLEWATPEEIVEGNKKFQKESWILRDTKFIELMFL